MPDFDLNTPSGDRGHEAIRVALVQAVQELGYNTDDIGLSLDLADTLFSLFDALSARVATLETGGA